MHIAKNVKVTELSLYEDAILDACCHNIPADDELWYRIVEVSVLLLTCTQRSNPRSPWYTLYLLVTLCFIPMGSFLSSSTVSEQINLVLLGV
jgi:hypothetical protein